MIIGASCSVHPQGKLVATASADHTACLWDLEDGTKLRTLEHADWVQAVAFHPQGKLVATASDDGTACLWDLEGTKKVHCSMIIRLMQ